MLHSLVVAFAGTGTGLHPDAAGGTVQHATAGAAEAPDQLGLGLQGALFGATAYQVITGSGP